MQLARHNLPYTDLQVHWIIHTPHAGDLSSISGSESSSDVSDGEEDTPPAPLAPTGSPFVFFTTGNGSVHGVYRSVLSSPKVGGDSKLMVDSLIVSGPLPSSLSLTVPYYKQRKPGRG